MSDYDQQREQNIKEIKARFAELFQNLDEDKKELQRLGECETASKPPPARRRNRKIRQEITRKYNTRSKSRPDYCELEDDDQKSLKVLFKWARPKQRDIDLMKVVCDFEENEQENCAKRRKIYVTRSPYDPNSIPSVDEITVDMLDNVVEKSSHKIHDKVNGTSCHQCRQKTRDTKTVCRSGECVGVRGQFCGSCLISRYGESAAEALKDPEWKCPPCRNICNCSICRTRNGLMPTGILAPIALGEGYNSVQEYLEANEGS